MYSTHSFFFFADPATVAAAGVGVVPPAARLGLLPLTAEAGLAPLFEGGASDTSCANCCDATPAAAPAVVDGDCSLLSVVVAVAIEAGGTV